MNQSVRLLIASTVTAAIIAPVMVFAQTSTTTATSTATTTASTSTVSTSTSAVSANIAALLAQIAVLKAQLSALIQQVISLGGIATSTPSGVDGPAVATSTASTTPPCPRFGRSLGLGMQGDDVRQMQQLLAANDSSFPQSGVTGYFGQKTQDAVKRLQQGTGVAVPTGFVGSSTLQVLGIICNEGNRQGDRMKHQQGMGSSTSPYAPIRLGDDRNRTGSSTMPYGPRGDGDHMNGTSTSQHPPMPPLGTASSTMGGDHGQERPPFPGMH